MEKQLKLFFWNNQNLFSNNYLEHRLPYTSLWSEQKEKARTAFDLIKKSYELIKDLHLGPGQEKELEDKFIRPVLSTLDFTYHVEPVTKRGYKKKRPDFALFEGMKSYRLASSVRDHPEKFFLQALTILESKYWGRRLNDTDRRDVLDSRDPTAQTVKYLDDVHFHTNGKINWAILTDGKHWRLFYYRAASRSGNFFEVDLEEIITNGKNEEFLYFYLFFSRDAFITDPATGKTWLDQHLKGTEEYAVRVSTKLKDLIFEKVFEGLAEGFVHFRRHELSIQTEADESRKNVFKGCLTLLYRLLFLLYAESRNLLPVDEHAYYKASLLNLKKDIYHDISTLGLGKMSKKSYSYWSRLQSLFDIVAKGDSVLNVPIYNGGLFEDSKVNFLPTHKMADPFLAEAIELLTVDHEGEYRPEAIPFIDYSSLNVRHLGDIYEGLLEFHVRIAEEDIVAVRKEGKSVWLKASEAAEKTKISGKKKKGEVYIENSRHERKATGSYYTPHYIVEYIVKNTVGPVLEERLRTAGKLLLELDEAYKTLRKQRSTVSIQGYKARIRELEDSIFNALFEIKVLDPAMGSGHFLVHTVDFISDRIISFLADYPENPVITKISQLKDEILQEITGQGVRIDERKLTEVNLIKRMVMKRCIYGVDLNDMAVELAKLSLWLDSFTLGAPLSFLDHHLKCGNSLIGIFEISDVIVPGSESYGKVQRALSFMLRVSDLTDATISEAQKSYGLFKNAQQEITPIRRRFDVSTAKHFADLGGNIGYLENLAYTLNFDKEPFPENIERCKKALLIAEEKKFFHWRLEFPEVFYTEKGEKETSGFDCVIGNPPYDVLSELEQERFVDPDKEFYKKNRLYSPAVGGKINYYRLFSILSLHLLRKHGEHGFIVPMALLADKQAKALREFVLKKYCLQRIEAFPQKDDPTNRVFPEAKLSTCIYILIKETPSSFSIRIHPGKDIVKTSTSLSITPSKIEEFDKDNLSIPSYPNMTAEDFHLALRLKRISKGISLKKFSPSQQGEVNLTEHADFLINENKGQIILRGAHINRYQFQEEPKQGIPMYLDVKRFLDAHGKDTKAYDHKYIRIGYQRGSAIDNWRRIIATIVEKNNFCSDTINYIIKPEEYNLFAILALLNSSLWEWRFRLTSTNNHVNSYEIDAMPMPPISFSTPEKERKERVGEAIELYEKYMLELDKGNNYEKTKDPKEHSRAVEGNPHTGRKTEKVSGKHSGTGKRVYGVRGRICRSEAAERVSEESEEYQSTKRYTRFIESSLGTKSYSELAPYLAKGVERVMASLLEHPADELKITPEFICKLHRSAFEEFFPSWAGHYRDRDITVGTYNPPPYYEVPILIRHYCDDVEFRLSSLGIKPQVNDILLEALAFSEGRLLSIHPFLDFNGRITRMLLFALLYRLDLPPVQLVPEEKDEKGKKEYLDALAKADVMDWQPLIEVWRKRLGSEQKL